MIKRWLQANAGIDRALAVLLALLIGTGVIAFLFLILVFLEAVFFGGGVSVSRL